MDGRLISLEIFFLSVEIYLVGESHLEKGNHSQKDTSYKMP